jgi:DNA repair exonuclease SbcCD ATPase subunit
MFISKSEKEELQQKVEDLLNLATQASDRAEKYEKKISELSSKFLNLQEAQIEQQLRTIKVIQEFEEIEGLSDKIIAKITTCDTRAEELENFIAARYRKYDEVEKDLKSMLTASRNAVANVSSLERRFDDFVSVQNVATIRVNDRIKILDNEQKVKNAKILSVEKVLEITRAVLFGVKKEVAINKKDLHDFCKIAVIRDVHNFALDGGQAPPKKVAAKARKTYSTKGIKRGPLPKTPEAPWGLKLDGKPRKRPGRKLKMENQECTAPI